MAFFPLLMCFTAGLIREQRQPDAALAQAEDEPYIGSERPGEQ